MNPTILPFSSPLPAKMTLPIPSRGPTSTSNWIYPGRLLVGAYPGNKESIEKHELIIKQIVDVGINTFISLIHDSELAKFRPYTEIATKLNPNIRFYRFGIRDQGITSDEEAKLIV